MTSAEALAEVDEVLEKLWQLSAKETEEIEELDTDDAADLLENYQKFCKKRFYQNEDVITLKILGTLN